MEYKDKKVIPFKGQYWWSDSENITSVLEEELKKLFGGTRINSIEIRGTDFSDGRENRYIKITIGDNKIEIAKNFL